MPSQCEKFSGDEHFLDPNTFRFLKASTRDLSLLRLKAHSGIDNFEIASDTSGRRVKAHWMTLILASGLNLRITFKTHFSSQDAVYLAYNTYRDEQISQPQLLDFLKEFCNLTIGGVKTYLEQNDLDIGTSLPMVLRGFNQLFFSTLVGKLTFSDSWLLKNEKATIACTADYEIFAPFQLNEFSASSSADGQFEFL